MKEKRNLLFKGKNGTTTQIIAAAIDKIKGPKKDKEEKTKRTLKDSFKSGKCRTPDLYDLGIGLEATDMFLLSGLDTMKDNMNYGKSNINSIKVGLVMSDRVISQAFRIMSLKAKRKDSLLKNLERIKVDSEISQATRDGIILKRETREENGVEKNFDVPVTEMEYLKLLEEYNKAELKMRRTKLFDYIKIGISVLSIFGMISRESGNKGENSQNKAMSIGSVVTSLIFFSTRLVSDKDEGTYLKYNSKANQQEINLLYNEQISNKSAEKKIGSYRENRAYSQKLKESFNLKLDLVVLASKISTLLFSGIYIHKGIKESESQKLDARLLSSLLINLESCKSAVGELTDVIGDVLDSKRKYDELEKLYERVENIERQMEEKVYSLEGAKEGFESFKIENLDGKFYPVKDYETGEITYGTHIKVPEFSMKKGDIVLLSGESGVGKSTFLRLLKRGDVNNRKCIELDNGEKVDNLGQEYISFRPSVNLGNETTVLEEITGKENISDLSKEEKEHLKKIMSDLELDSEDIFEKLASKKFMQFSTGQQRRIALSKVFYEVEESTSILIVDEPVGNVEDRLIREQLKLIKNVAKKNNVMLILVTHRTDLAEDLVNKRYHISKEGIMEEIPINKEKEVQEK